MVHKEVYTIHGNKYKYEVTNYRDKNGKVKHKKKYLGAVKPKYKERK